MRFSTRILLDGNNTGIPVPAEVVAQLGTKRRYPVRVTIGAHSYRSSVAPYRGRFMISLSADNRARAGVAGGDEVEVELELDDAPREVDVPEDFAAALAAEEAARERFSALSFSNQNRIVLGIEGAKAPETRRRRIEKALAELTLAG